MGKHIFLPTDFWIVNTQTIQDPRIEDICQEAGDKIYEMTKKHNSCKEEASPSNLDGHLQESVAHIMDMTLQ